MLKIKFGLLFILLVLIINYTFGISPKEYSVDTYSEFAEGELNNVSLRSDGRLILSPQVETIYKSEEAYIWCLGIDTRHNLYIAEGTEGRLFKISKDGKKKELYFDAEELNINTLVIDKNNNIYVGTNPDGKVYKITNKNQYEIIFDPPEKYIWSLLFDKKGNLYIATGEKAKIYKISKDKKVKVIFESNETHIRCLAIDTQGNLIAGTDGEGLILRIDRKGKPFIIYDSGAREITQIVIDNENNIYAAALIGKIKEKKEMEIPLPPQMKEIPVIERLFEGMKMPPLEELEQHLEMKPPEPTIKKGKSEVYLIDKEGYVKTLFASDKENVLSLAFHKNNLLLGTGDEGFIYSIEEKEKINKLLKTNSKQVTTLIRSNNKIYAGLSNLAQVILIKEDFAPQGSFLSKVYDTKTAATTWGIIKYKSDTPSFTTLNLFTRTGNQATPSELWTDFEKVKNEQHIKNIKARFIQFKAELKTKKSTLSPVLDKVTIYYMENNLPPEIKNIEIHPPGIYFKKLPPPPEEFLETAFHPLVTEKMPKEVKPKKEYKYGMRAVSWEAIDKNNDELVYKVYYKSEDDKNWKLIADKLKEKYFSFDATSLPDGKYYIKIGASDELSNPPKLTHYTERISDLFIIDHTSPTIRNIKHERIDKESIKLTFEVIDEVAAISQVKYSINAKIWELVYPIDLITDSTKENYAIYIDKLSKGEHSILIKAYDKNGNIQSEEVRINLE